VSFADPFDALREGWEFATLGRTVGEADVVAFGALTGDLHPQHMDAAWAAQSPFGERIAHGMLLLSYAVGLTPFDPLRVRALRGLREVVFKRPVRLGDTISVRGRVSSLRELDEHSGLVRCRLSIVNQDEQLCCRAEIELIWAREAVAERV
jgi:acyl dehydratase